MAHHRSGAPPLGLLLLLLAAPVALAQDLGAPMQPSELIWRIILCIVLVGLAGVFSGLTLAILSLDPNQLHIITEAGSPRERKYAAKILTVRKDGNLLLCTLLWSNMAVNSLLSVTMAGMGGEVVGVLVSTPLLVLFGEIIPQASCSRHALPVGFYLTDFMRLCIFVLYPISKPIALALDHFLGEEVGTLYSKREMQSLLRMHVQTNLLHPREAAIMAGAITFRERLVKDVATPVERMFSLKSSDRLDYQLMTQIYRTGYSRIPVWNDEETNIVGVLYAKDLMLVNATARLPVIAVVHFFGRQHLNVVDDEDTLETALRHFSASRQHFAIVRTVDSSGLGDPTYKIAGVVSMEDVMESIWGEEILDEFDVMRSTDPPPGPNSLETGKGAFDAISSPSAAALEEGGSGGSTAPDPPRRASAVHADDSGLLGGAPPSAPGGAATSGSSSQHAAGSGVAAQQSTTRRRQHGLLGGTVDAGKSGAQVAREEAALRRLKEVALNDAEGRGVNNELSGQEVRALAAHLLYNVAAFRTPAVVPSAVAAAAASPSGPTLLSFNMMERLVRQCDVIDLVAPPKPPPPGAVKPSAAAGTGAPAPLSQDAQSPNEFLRNKDAALVDPTQFGVSLLRSLRGGGGGKRRASGSEHSHLLGAAGHRWAPDAEDAAAPNTAPVTPGGGGEDVADGSAEAAAALVASIVGAPGGGAGGLGVGGAGLDDNGALLPDPTAAWLYLRGESTSVCTVVLRGSLELLAGNDAVSCEKGPWDVVAERALTMPRGSYVPDFAARPITPLVRCLRITREDYEAALNGTLPDLRYTELDPQGKEAAEINSAAAALVSTSTSSSVESPAAAAAAASRSNDDVRLLVRSHASSDSGGIVDVAPLHRLPAAALDEAAASATAAASPTTVRRINEETWRVTRNTTLPPAPFSLTMEGFAPTLQPGEGGRPATGPAVRGTKAAAGGAGAPLASAAEAGSGLSVSAAGSSPLWGSRTAGAAALSPSLLLPPKQPTHHKPFRAGSGGLTPQVVVSPPPPPTDSAFAAATAGVVGSEAVTEAPP